MAIHASAVPHHLRAVDPVIARRALAVFVGAHGVAHLVGTSTGFSRAADGRSVDYLAGKWTLADPTTLRIFGMVWALMTLAFLLTAAFIWAGRPAWPRLLWWVSLASLVLVLIGLWTSVIGVFIDVALLTIAWRAGALSPRS